MNPREHPLFKRYPLNGTATLSTGNVPTPYHIYNGYGAFIGGTADLSAVRQLLAPEQVQPLQNSGARALMGLWVCDFTEASLGPHHELQFSIFVTRGDAAPIDTHPLALLAAMLSRPDVEMMCHGLWNNTPTVVAYNREVLSLNARLCDSTIERSPDRLSFTFRDRTAGASLCQGHLGKPGKASWRAGLAFAMQLGWQQAGRMARQPWVSMRVVNPLGVSLPANMAAEALTKNDTNAVRYFDSTIDALSFGDTPYKSLAFEPRFVQYIDGIKFVYQNPA